MCHNFHPDKTHSAQELCGDATDSQIQSCEWFNAGWLRGEYAIFSDKVCLHLTIHADWHKTVYLVHDNPHVTVDAYRQTNTRKPTWRTIHGNTLLGPAFLDIASCWMICLNCTSMKYHSLYDVLLWARWNTTSLYWKGKKLWSFSQVWHWAQSILNGHQGPLTSRP